MSELSGNRWVKNFTIFLKDLIRERKSIKVDELYWTCMLNHGVKQLTVEKYLNVMESAGIINITSKEENKIVVWYVNYQGVG